MVVASTFDTLNFARLPSSFLKVYVVPTRTLLSICSGSPGLTTLVAHDPSINKLSKLPVNYDFIKNNFWQI